MSSRVNAENAMSENNNALAAYLRDHPRMIGVLFTITLLLSQAGSAVAGNATTISGP